MKKFFKVITLLRCYTVLVGSWLSSLQDNLSVPFSKVKQSKKNWTASPLKMGPVGCLETSVTNYQSTLCNIPKGVDLIYNNAEA
jgi:hypothetical protein